MKPIETISELETYYGAPSSASLVKETDHLVPVYRQLIAASPFLGLATVGPDGLDCSPRGDRPGELLRIVDDQTVMLPDRRGNNRIDSLRNIVADPRVALLFLIPGSGTTLRVNGRAIVTADPALCQSFAVEGKPPRSVIVITVEKVYFQCSRAVIRSDLWNPDHYAGAGQLPTAGQILASLSDGQTGGADYDKQWPERAKASLW
jgi:PPOX class probable FMN-dependent enzyme